MIPREIMSPLESATSDSPRKMGELSRRFTDMECITDCGAIMSCGLNCCSSRFSRWLLDTDMLLRGLAAVVVPKPLRELDTVSTNYIIQRPGNPLRSVRMSSTLRRPRPADGVQHALVVVPGGATSRARHVGAGVTADLLLSASPAALE